MRLYMKTSPGKEKKKPNIQRLHEKVTNLYNAGQFQKAKKLAISTLEEHPNDGITAFIIAVCTEREGKLQDAIQFCRKAVAATPGNRDYRKKLAALLLKTKQLDEAQTLFQSLHEEDANDREPLNGLAEIYKNAEDTLNMYRCLLKLKRLGPLSEIEQICIVEGLNCMTSMPDSEDQEKDLNDFLDYSSVNPNKLISIINDHFCTKYKLAADDPTIDIEKLINDKLLHKAASKVRFCSRYLEELFTKLRHSITSEISSNQTIALPFIPLIEAIALQNQINEYIHSISSDEQQVIEFCSKLLSIQAKDDNWSPRQSDTASESIST